jgi:Dolichyl-phosphate-mannose-protein mannosyltransferase
VRGARLARRAELRRVQILNRVVDRYASVPPGYRDLAVFGVAFLIRFGFLVLTDFDHYSRIPDSKWIMALSDRAARLDFDYDIGRFVAAPFYQTMVGMLKRYTGSAWPLCLNTLQLSVASVSVVCLGRLAYVLFRSRLVELFTVALFAIFPLTLYWVGTYSTETWFQSVLVLVIYFLCAGVARGRWVDVVVSAVLYGVCFLTKSHILLFAPFIVGYMLLARHLALRRRVAFALGYGAISLSMTLPYGLYSLMKYQTYILASNGFGYEYYLGNSPGGYASVVDGPPQGKELQDMGTRGDEVNGPGYDEAMALSQHEKQPRFLAMGVQWNRDNPVKTWRLKLDDLLFFLQPGVSFRHYRFLPWLLSFMCSVPVYVLAYWGIGHALRTNFRAHAWMAGLVTSMLVFAVVLYPQSRFRTITLEPYYLLYAASMLAKLVGG